MDPVQETEFSDCGSIESEGKPTNKFLYQFKPMPILQRAIDHVQKKLTPEIKIEPGMRRQTLLKIIDKNIIED